MLSFCNVSAQQAEHYYEKDNYYTLEESEQSQAYWVGKGAAVFGLSGSVEKEQFVDLLYGLAPDGTELAGKLVDPERHRAATDYTFSAPKSASIAALVQGDDRVIQAHHKAVQTALAVLEKRYAQTRITIDKGRQRITTANMIAAVFTHDVSREQEPQLHSHCVVINATQLSDGCWRSFSNEEVVANQKLLGQLYQNELAYELKSIGYQIEAKSHGQFEVSGYSKELLEVFSTRRKQIQQILELWETERERIVNADGNPIATSAARREAATLRTRQKKPKEMPREKLVRGWQAIVQLKALELPLLPEQHLRLGFHPDLNRKAMEAAIASAIDHCSEREAVFKRTKLERFILENHLGQHSFNTLDYAIETDNELVRIATNKYTTQAALYLELNTIQIMQEGQGQVKSIAYPEQVSRYLENKQLTAGQQKSIELAITTGDRIIAWQGVAGSGKSYALKEVRAIAQAQGYRVRGFAPSAEAASSLSGAIQTETDTVAGLLVSQDSETSEKQLWIVDEAGLLSMRQAHDLLNRALAANARVLLVGDTRQLSAMEAGNPFKSLQAGGIAIARLDESLRQRTQELRGAVKAIAQGSTAEGIHQLEQAGCMAEIPEESDRLNQIISDYMSLSSDHRNQTLLLAGTNQDRLKLTHKLRQALQTEGTLEQNASAITGLRPRDLTVAQAGYVSAYEIGDVIIPHQTYKKQGLTKNERYRVVAKNDQTNRLILSFQGEQHLSIDPAQCPRKAVYQPQVMPVAIGDRLRWTKNDRAKGIRNGQAFTITGFEGNKAQIQSDDGRAASLELDSSQYVDYAWVNTIYSAQGKTSDRVLVLGDSSLNQESFYVACSRAKYQLTLYIADKTELLRSAQRSRVKENVSDYLAIDSIVPQKIASNQLQLHLSHEFSQPTQWNDRTNSGSLSTTDSRPTQPAAGAIHLPDFSSPAATRTAKSTGGAGEPDESANSGSRAEYTELKCDIEALATNLIQHVDAVSCAVAGYLEQREIERCAACLAAAVEGVDRHFRQIEQAGADRSRLTAAVDRLNEQLGAEDRSPQLAEKAAFGQIQPNSSHPVPSQPQQALLDIAANFHWKEKQSYVPILAVVQREQQQVNELRQQLVQTEQELQSISEGLATAAQANFFQRLFQDAEELQCRRSHRDHLRTIARTLSEDLAKAESSLRSSLSARQQEMERLSTLYATLSHQIRQRTEFQSCEAVDKAIAVILLTSSPQHQILSNLEALDFSPRVGQWRLNQSDPKYQNKPSLYVKQIVAIAERAIFKSQRRLDSSYSMQQEVDRSSLSLES